MRPAKKYSPADQAANWELALRGNKFSPHLLRYVDDWARVFAFLPSLPLPGKANRKILAEYGLTAKDAKAAYKSLVGFLVCMLKDGLEKENGIFFRWLGEVMEHRKHLSDPNRLWLHSLYVQWRYLNKRVVNQKLLPLYTCRQLCEKAAQRSWNVSSKRMRVICKEMGYPLAKSKPPGRPPKKREHFQNR